ncbi:MAG: universal stress protein [Chloroflexi bacterium]|nr:universal stress protein [Chloroflexota bacterium]
MLHNTHCPLLLVRPDATERAPAIEKILVPLDGSQLSLAVLPFIKETAKALGASLVLFHAVAPVGTFPGVEMGAASVGHLLQGLEDQAQQFLREAVKEVKEYGVDASYAVVIGFPVDSVIRAAEDTGADLIALSTHGRSGLGRAVMGSVADGVVRRISLPCLIVRPPEVEKGS